MILRGVEVNYDTRAIIIYSGFKRKSLSIIRQELGRLKEIYRDIRRHIMKRAKRTKLLVFHEINIVSYYRNERPKMFSER